MICLSFDTDHMNEQRMIEFLSLVHFPGQGTFFCTKFFNCLTQTEHEIAPHPNLNNGTDWHPELIQKRYEFPLATGWRSHACVFSHGLAEWIGKQGYKYVSVHDDFGRISMKPIKHSWGIWHLPIYYMDNLDFSKKNFWKEADNTNPFEKDLIINSLNEDGLYVFDFHPIHLLLNTPEPSFYFDKRDKFLTGVPIQELCYKGYGTLNFFRDLCFAMQTKGINSISMGAALDAYINTTL